MKNWFDPVCMIIQKHLFKLKASGHGILLLIYHKNVYEYREGKISLESTLKLKIFCMYNYYVP